MPIVDGCKRSMSMCRSLQRPFLDGRRICRSLQPRLKHQGSMQASRYLGQLAVY